MFDPSSMAAVQAQLSSLTGGQSMLDISNQELVMTTDSLDANEGKVIRIVSLNQDGSILSLGDPSHMQILNDETSQSSQSPVSVGLFVVIVVYASY